MTVMFGLKRDTAHLHVVSLLEGSDSTSLHKVLINSYKTDNVTAGYIFNWFNISSHHQDSSKWRNSVVISNKNNLQQ